MNENRTSASSTSNVNVTWPKRMRNRHRDAGWLGIIDGLGHRLRVPQRFMRPVCDLYDIAAGIPKRDIVEMDYDGKAPWWLR